MSLSFKTNQLTGPATTGASATTDPGFQPGAILLFNGLQTSVVGLADAQWSLGVASSSSSEVQAGKNSDNGTASSDVSRVFSNTDVIRNLTAGTNTVNVSATLTSLDATGFTLNFGTLTTVLPVYNYLAFGGADITNTASGNFAAAGSTGNQAITGLGFRPDVVFLFATIITTAGQANNTNQYCFGAMNSSGQWVMGSKAQNAQATMNTSRMFYNNKVLAMPATASNAVFFDAQYVSLDSDGFTINITTTGGTALLIGYLAIKGGQWKIGTETQKTSTGTKATTGTGFTPKGVLFGSVIDTQTTGTADNDRLMFGSTDGTQNTALFYGDSDNTANAVSSTIMSNTKCLVMGTEAGATPTTQAEANISSLDSDGFTLDWTTADATARVFGYVAFGDTAVSVRKNLTLLGVG
jgi:hypothetical protein